MWFVLSFLLVLGVFQTSLASDSSCSELACSAKSLAGHANCSPEDTFTEGKSLVAQDGETKIIVKACSQTQPYATEDIYFSVIPYVVRGQVTAVDPKELSVTLKLSPGEEISKRKVAKNLEHPDKREVSLRYCPITKSFNIVCPTAAQYKDQQIAENPITSFYKNEKHSFLGNQIGFYVYSPKGLRLGQFQQNDFWVERFLGSRDEYYIFQGGYVRDESSKNSILIYNGNSKRFSSIAEFYVDKTDLEFPSNNELKITFKHDPKMARSDEFGLFSLKLLQDKTVCSANTIKALEKGGKSVVINVRLYKTELPKIVSCR